MKRFLAVVAILLGAICFAPQSLVAKNYTPKSVPNVQAEDYRRFVSNPDNVLSAEAVYRIDTTLLSLRTNRVAEVAVVAVESIGFAEPREFVHELFRHWGIGEKGRDNGLLVLLVVGQGAIEIETGYGLEGVLPDALCKRIIERVMIPHFKEGDFDSGMLEGVGAIASVLTTNVVPEELAAEDDFPIWGVAIAMGAILLFVALIVALVMLNSRCPKCKKSALKRTGERLEVNKNAHYRTYKVAYKCQHCGHIIWRFEDEDLHGGTGGGPIIMGGGGFGRGRGFGGGFGGGFSGGGGAGGRF
ncbi:MAG: TPM domain-containing protein [Tidjanibacter sp.]|nr:TPM domain-containing protein [Tidjanibacter sp.]